MILLLYYYKIHLFTKYRCLQVLAGVNTTPARNKHKIKNKYKPKTVNT